MSADPQYTPASLTSLLKSLSLSDSEDNHEQILKHANNVLKKHKTDNQAIRTKLVALIKLDRYEDALEFLKGVDVRDVELEQAYCLYKVGRIQEAVEVARQDVGGDRRKRGLKHVEAQALYRLENFEEALSIYKSLALQPPLVSTETYDLRVNTGAAETQLVFSGREDLVPKTKTKREDLETFETAFNAACQSIARCEYAAGSVLLKTARKLCESMEGLSPEEMQEELAPVVAQEIYQSLTVDKVLHATELSQASKIRETSDAAVKVIATNNDVLTLPTQNPHLALRLYENISKIPTTTSSQPFSFQSKIIERNAATLAYQIGKANAARSLSNSYLQKHTDDYSTSTIIAAASIPDPALDVKHKSTAKLMLGLIEKHPKDIGLAFTAIQAYMKARNTVGAVQVGENLIKALEDEPRKRYAPAVVGVIVGLHHLQGKKALAKEELDKATTYWKEQDQPNAAVLLASASASLHSTNQQDQKLAATLFHALNTNHPSPLSNAGTIASDPQNASDSQISQLTPLDTLISSINIDSLVASGIATTVKSTTTNVTTTTRKRPIDDSAQKAKPAKKKRKLRLPKGGIDPNKKPDPERWLPLRDRSSYKPKGKKDKKRMKDLTQGGVVASGAAEAGVGVNVSETLGGNSVKKAPLVQKKKKGKR